jgi:hypothetical protein
MIGVLIIYISTTIGRRGNNIEPWSKDWWKQFVLIALAVLILQHNV